MDNSNDDVWAEMYRLGMLEQARVDAAKLAQASFVAARRAGGAAAEAAAETVGERLIIRFEQGRPNGS